MNEYVLDDPVCPSNYEGRHQYYYTTPNRRPKFSTNIGGKRYAGGTVECKFCKRKVQYIEMDKPHFKFVFFVECERVTA